MGATRESGKTGELQHAPCLLSSTGYLHDLGIIHRDVKVELSAFFFEVGLRSSNRSKKAVGS